MGRTLFVKVSDRMLGIFIIRWRPRTMKPRELMQTYLDDVVSGGRLELIEELANEGMVELSNNAFIDW